MNYYTFINCILFVCILKCTYLLKYSKQKKNVTLQKENVVNKIYANLLNDELFYIY